MESVQVENVAHVTLYDTSNWLQRAQGPTKKKKSIARQPTRP